MIEARPSRFWKWFWGNYFERRIKQTFYRCLIQGEGGIAPWRRDKAGRPSIDEPLILYCSHGSWWDAAATITLSLRDFDFDGYGVMEEVQVERYKFFTRLGLFSVHRQDPRSAIESLRYGARLLQGQGRVLWIFPQGELVHQEQRPITVYPGLGILLKMLNRAWFAPVALRYDFLKEERPEMIVRIGAPEMHKWSEWGSINTFTEDCASKLHALMDQTREDCLTGNFSAYRTFLSGKGSIEKRLNALRGLD